MFRKQSGPILAGVVFAFAAAAAAQKFQPKAIRFVGDPEYSDAELLKAADLRLGDVLSAAEMNQHTQKLMDTGVFAGIAYKFDGEDLTFQITPAPLYPVRFENLPIAVGPDLDARLRAALPLYHGKAPADGTVLTGLCAALQDQLKAQGISATITPAPYSDQALHKITAMSLTISSPSVVMGDIRVEGVASLPDEARALLARLVGSPYDREGSSQAIVQDLGQIYRDQGYLDARIHAQQTAALAIAPDAVRVPFSASIETGPLYTVKSIQLAPGLLVSQADFDKQANTHPGDPATAPHIRENWHFIERQYHNRGYMKARVNAAATLDRAQNTVSYAVSVDPGPVYTMGTLSIQNVSDDLRAMMLAAWKMQPGTTFNEGAILGFFATHSVNPKLERIFAVVNCKYVLRLNDDTHTVDVTLRLERRS